MKSITFQSKVNLWSTQQIKLRIMRLLDGSDGRWKAAAAYFENDHCKIVFLKQSAEIQLCIHIHHNFYADVHNQFALAYNKLTIVRHAKSNKQTKKQQKLKKINKIKQNGLLIAIDKDAATQPIYSSTVRWVCSKYGSVCVVVKKWRLHALSHWGRVTHICASNPTRINSDNGLSPGRRQAIIWINTAVLLIGPLATNISEILIEIHTFSFKKMHLKMSSGNGSHFDETSMRWIHF